jgi:hypothetical protein
MNSSLDPVSGHYICDYCDTDLGEEDVHNYTAVFHWEEDYSAGTVTYTCSNCGKTETEAAIVTHRVTAGCTYHYFDSDKDSFHYQVVKNTTNSWIAQSAECGCSHGAYTASTGCTLNGNHYYTTLSAAFDTAHGGSSKVWLLDGARITGTQNAVPANKTLLLPHSATDVTGINVGLTGTEADVVDSSQFTSGSTDRMAWNYPSVYRHMTATIAADAVLTVDGTMIVGGILYRPNAGSQSHTSGNYAHLIIEEKGTLAVNGRLNTPGLVTGAGKINLGTKGTLKLPLLLNDFSGGHNMTALQDYSEFFPMGMYATNNVQCEMVMQGGARVISYTSIYASSYGAWGMMEAGLIGTQADMQNGKYYFLYLHNGATLTATYDAEKKLSINTGVNLRDFGKQTLTIEGDATGGTFYYNYMMLEATTHNKYLPIPYNFDIIV